MTTTSLLLIGVGKRGIKATQTICHEWDEHYTSNNQGDMYSLTIDCRPAQTQQFPHLHIDTSVEEIIDYAEQAKQSIELKDWYIRSNVHIHDLDTHEYIHDLRLGILHYIKTKRHYIDQTFKTALNSLKYKQVIVYILADLRDAFASVAVLDVIVWLKTACSEGNYRVVYLSVGLALPEPDDYWPFARAGVVLREFDRVIWSDAISIYPDNGDFYAPLRENHVINSLWLTDLSMLNAINNSDSLIYHWLNGILVETDPSLDGLDSFTQWRANLSSQERTQREKQTYITKIDTASLRLPRRSLVEGWTQRLAVEFSSQWMPKQNTDDFNAVLVKWFSDHENTLINYLTKRYQLNKSLDLSSIVQLQELLSALDASKLWAIVQPKNDYAIDHAMLLEQYGNLNLPFLERSGSAISFVARQIDDLEISSRNSLRQLITSQFAQYQLGIVWELLDHLSDVYCWTLNNLNHNEVSFSNIVQLDYPFYKDSGSKLDQSKWNFLQRNILKDYISLYQQLHQKLVGQVVLYYLKKLIENLKTDVQQISEQLQSWRDGFNEGEILPIPVYRGYSNPLVNCVDYQLMSDEWQENYFKHHQKGWKKRLKNGLKWGNQGHLGYKVGITPTLYLVLDPTVTLVNDENLILAQNNADNQLEWDHDVWLSAARQVILAHTPKLVLLEYLDDSHTDKSFSAWLDHIVDPKISLALKPNVKETFNLSQRIIFPNIEVSGNQTRKFIQQLEERLKRLSIPVKFDQLKQKNAIIYYRRYDFIPLNALQSYEEMRQVFAELPFDRCLQLCVFPHEANALRIETAIRRDYHKYLSRNEILGEYHLHPQLWSSLGDFERLTNFLLVLAFNWFNVEVDSHKEYSLWLKVPQQQSYKVLHTSQEVLTSWNNLSAEQKIESLTRFITNQPINSKINFLMLQEACQNQLQETYASHKEDIHKYFKQRQDLLSLNIEYLLEKQDQQISTDITLFYLFRKLVDEIEMMLDSTTEIQLRDYLLLLCVHAKSNCQNIEKIISNRRIHKV